MNKSNSGYGICGARNVYNSKVKLDNWVEDEIGAIIASKSRPAIGDYRTVSRVMHCDPKDMPERYPAPANMPSTLELLIKNKEGTPYTLLFGHGKGEEPHDERYLTMARRTAAKLQDPQFAPLADGYLANERAKNVRREINLAYKRTSQYRTATAFRKNMAEYTTPHKLHGEVGELPQFHRHCPLTSTFPQH